MARTVLSLERLSLDCSEYMGTTVCPKATSPLSGCSCPIIILNSVDLPEPLPPMMPAQHATHHATYQADEWHCRPKDLKRDGA